LLTPFLKKKCGSREELIIITNLPKEEYSSEEVLNIYKRRWDIEVFFKSRLPHFFDGKMRNIPLQAFRR